MDTNRLSKTVSEALNTQITKEAHAAQIYLSYGAWAAKQGFGGIANFLFKHALEERNHMMKFLEYILKRGAEVEITAIPVPAINPVSLFNCFEKILEHEVDNTNAIYKIANLSHEEQDWATWNFMQWFVNEQVEEETLVMGLLDKLNIAGGEKMTGNTLYAFDRDIEKNAVEVIQE